MLEIEIIKYYLFSKEERKLISIISNHDFIELDKNRIYKKIEVKYQKDKFYLNNIEDLLTKLLVNARDNKQSNKLLQLVQIGNHKLFYSEDI